MNETVGDGEYTGSCLYSLHLHGYYTLVRVLQNGLRQWNA